MDARICGFLFSHTGFGCGGVHYMDFLVLAHHSLHSLLYFLLASDVNDDPAHQGHSRKHHFGFGEALETARRPKAWLSYLKLAESAFSSKLLLQNMKKWRKLNRELFKRTARSPQKGNMFSHFILRARKAAASSCCLAVPGAVGLSFYNNYSI